MTIFERNGKAHHDGAILRDTLDSPTKCFRYSPEGPSPPIKAAEDEIEFFLEHLVPIALGEFE
jgi:hypothetical protein